MSFNRKFSEKILNLQKNSNLHPFVTWEDGRCRNFLIGRASNCRGADTSRPGPDGRNWWGEIILPHCCRPGRDISASVHDSADFQVNMGRFGFGMNPHPASDAAVPSSLLFAGGFSGGDEQLIMRGCQYHFFCEDRVRSNYILLSSRHKFL